jgi:exosome complex RNA-binding protein Rrp42 (RNase PH superfamily)
LPVITRTDKGEYVRAAELTLPLKLNFVPVSASFTVVDKWAKTRAIVGADDERVRSQYIIADPSLEEEEFASASLVACDRVCVAAITRVIERVYVADYCRRREVEHHQRAQARR